MWPFSKKTPATRIGPPIYFTNTLTGKKELFTPLRPRQVLLYTCGPTVYGPAHIGNLRAYVFSDTVARMLTHAGYRVRRVINITDVGHLTDDADDGEDKMEASARREHTTAEAIAARYTRRFLEDLELLNVDPERIDFPRATAYIPEQIALAEAIEQKGFAYRASGGLYFDTARFPGYGKLAGIDDAALREGARVAKNSDKRHPADFALWKLSRAGDKRQQEWNSPWGRGFPGWHLECSAMARSLLGPEIDIHTGGEDLAPIHHNNEIAQSESISGRPFVRFWMHNAFLTMNGEKASKSLGNVVYLSDIVARGIHPLALRYFFLQAHYRTPLSFSFDALVAAEQGLLRLWRIAEEVARASGGHAASSPALERFVCAVREDLSTSSALGILWDGLRDDDLSEEERWGLVAAADALFGLSLSAPPAGKAPLSREDLLPEIRALLDARDRARERRDFTSADRLRDELSTRGYRVDDGPSGTIVSVSEE